MTCAACSPSPSTISGKGNCSSRGITSGRSRFTITTTAIVSPSPRRSRRSLPCRPELAEMDETALYEYLTLRIIAPPRSMFRKIRKLPPAHFLIFQDGKISIHRYWHLRYEPKRQGDFRSTVEELERQMMSTVRYHLVSDVPVGAFLSGGMDSSLIVAMMSRYAKEPINTFSGDVPYKGFSEIPYAKMVSDRYGTIGHNLTINPSLIRTLPELVWHLDEPSDPLSVCMYYISELARKEVKVVLGGDGGDELFGGYDRYYGNAYVSYYALLPEFFRKQVMGKLLKHVSEGFWYRSFSHKLRWFHQLSFYEGAERYSKSLGYFYFSNGRGSGLYTESFRKSVAWFDPEGCIKECFNSDNASGTRGQNALCGHDDPDAGSPGDDPGPDDDGARSRGACSVPGSQARRVLRLDPPGVQGPAQQAPAYPGGTGEKISPAGRDRQEKAGIFLSPDLSAGGRVPLSL